VSSYLNEYLSEEPLDKWEVLLESEGANFLDKDHRVRYRSNALEVEFQRRTVYVRRYTAYELNEQDLRILSALDESNITPHSPYATE
jgi:histidinol-phosphate/aromatic aminotransferase/cobyric acid decarboxylase-like protein